MSVDVVKIELPSTLTQERWRDVPVAIAVDIDAAACQIDPAIRPLRPAGKQPRLFGRAVTALCEPPDFGPVMHALDLMAKGDVLVISAGGDGETAMIGGILGGLLRDKGCAGLICDGAIRDVAELAAFDDFSVYSRSITPRGPVSFERGSVNTSVQFGGQEISPGDLILGDDDGLARLTPDMASAFYAHAADKMTLEEGWVKRLKAGETAKDVFGL